MMRPRIRNILLAAGVLTAVAAGSVFIPIPEDELSPLPVVSLRLTDRNGQLLREVLSDRGGRAYWLSEKDIPPAMVNAAIAAEDTRFWYHPGIDPLSIARALSQNVTSGRVVSGGSTITQQVVRSLDPVPRSVSGKLLEAWRAMRLEQTISKKEIMVQYLNRVPYGNGTFGVEAASELYFDKPARVLSIAEAAFLAALPNAPGASNPYRSLARAVARQRVILQRMLNAGMMTSEEYTRAMEEDIRVVPARRKLRAPHMTDMVLQQIPDSLRRSVSAIRTTIDARLQQAVEGLLAGHIASLKRQRATNGAVLVLDNTTGDILAMAGSVDYFDSIRSGQVNGALALRQPGSALKPFLYGLALESGLTAAEIIPDIPFNGSLREGAFTPENYDRSFHGPVRLRTALACSYNVPAVRLADRVGVEALLERLHAFGFRSLDKDAGHYGLALALGDGEVSLLELATAYAALARGGLYRPSRPILEITGLDGAAVPVQAQESFQPVLSPPLTFILTSILTDQDARRPAFGMSTPLDLPFPCAAKTGTSKDYKDNWTVGYTTRFTVAVWVGNFDARPMCMVSGITGAGPLFRDVMLYLHQREYPSPAVLPPGVVPAQICARSGELPGQACAGTMTEYFLEGTVPAAACRVHSMHIVDTRTNRLAAPETPEAYRRSVVIERFPPVFDAWQEAVRSRPGPNLPVDGAGESAPSRSMPLAALQFGIVAPDDGAVFRIDPVLRKEYQKMKITVAAAGHYHDVELLVDGKSFAPVGDMHAISWQLEEGAHVFQLRARRGAREVHSSSVHILVME